MTPGRAAGLGSIALGVGIAVGSILGPLLLGVIDFRTSAHLENQFVGGEVVSLGLVAPAAVAAGVLWLRGLRLAPALTLGPALYAVYTYTTAVIGQEYGRYDGNVEKFFPLYAGLVGGGAALAAYAWSHLLRLEASTPGDGMRRSLAGIFVALGSLFALTWAAQIRLVYVGRPPVEYEEGPTLFWLIKLLDFGFMIPLLIVTGVGLLHSHPTAVRAAYGLAVFATCLAGSVAAMAAAMELRDDPSSQPAMLVVLVPATVGLALLTARLLRSFLDGTAADRRGPTPGAVSRRAAGEA
jgi:hypothetical protein